MCWVTPSAPHTAKVPGQFEGKNFSPARPCGNDVHESLLPSSIAITLGHNVIYSGLMLMHQCQRGGK